MLLSVPGGRLSSQIRTRSFSRTTRSPIGPSTRVSPVASLMRACSRRYAPGRSGPALLRAGIPGSRPLRSCSFLLVSIAADAVDAEAHEVVGLGGGRLGAVDQMVAQRPEHG